MPNPPTARELIEADAEAHYNDPVSRDRFGYCAALARCPVCRQKRALRDRAEASFALALEALESIKQCPWHTSTLCDQCRAKVRRALAAMNGEESADARAE